MLKPGRCRAASRFCSGRLKKLSPRTLPPLMARGRYEEFPDNHSSVDYRMDESLPFLARALSG
jgi:hypothetical protein